MLRKIKGFSLFELVIVLTMIAVLIAVAIDKLPAWQAMAERTAMESVSGSLRSALGIKVASCIVKSDMTGVRALEGSNPMDQLSETPGNYVGVRRGAEIASVEAGHWYYDAAARELVYRVREAELFKSAPALPAEVRFAVRLVMEDRNGKTVAVQRQIEGVQLVEVQSYSWPN